MLGAEECGCGGRLRGALVAVALALSTLLPLASIQVLAAQPSGWGWGQNNSGQAGTGTNKALFAIQPMRTIPGLRSVFAGMNFGVALGAGAVWTWGAEAKGQLGNHKSPDSWRGQPKRVVGLPDIVTASAGTNHVLALGKNGTVWAWGDDTSGELGSGNQQLGPCLCIAKPVKVHKLRHVVAIGAGNGYSVAVRADGTVWAWGTNAFGQLGRSQQLVQSSVPMRVDKLKGIRRVAAGDSQVLALGRGGKVFDWGADSLGQLGDGTVCGYYRCFRHKPTRVRHLPLMRAVAAGGDDSAGISRSGRIWTWGDNGFGQLGVMRSCTSERIGCVSNVPVEVGGIRQAAAMAVGGDHMLAARSNGRLFAWGDNLEGQLGIGSRQVAKKPILVKALSGRAVSIAAGNYFSLAVTK